MKDGFLCHMCELAALQVVPLNFKFLGSEIMGSQLYITVVHEWSQMFTNCSFFLFTNFLLMVFAHEHMSANWCWSLSEKKTNWEIGMFVYSPWFLVKNLWIILLKSEAQN